MSSSDNFIQIFKSHENTSNPLRLRIEYIEDSDTLERNITASDDLSIIELKNLPPVANRLAFSESVGIRFISFVKT